MNVTEHRPWPVPSRPWIMRQTWRDLLFAHWPIDAAVLRRLVPQVLKLDLWSGGASENGDDQTEGKPHGWVAVTPFNLTGLRLRWTPPIPTASSFLELNVRTYVCYEGRPGVFFFSLDAESLAAVLGARASYFLPYYHARMSQKQTLTGFEYSSQRRGATRPELLARYTPVSAVQQPRPGSLEQWLVERYCLYAPHKARLYCAEIHHVPWPLQEARAVFEVNTMTQAAGIELPAVDPICHFAKELDVLVWKPERLL